MTDPSNPNVTGQGESPIVGRSLPINAESDRKPLSRQNRAKLRPAPPSSARRRDLRSRHPQSDDDQPGHPRQIQDFSLHATGLRQTHTDDEGLLRAGIDMFEALYQSMTSENDQAPSDGRTSRKKRAGRARPTAKPIADQRTS
jgi:hypothetical protein